MDELDGFILLWKSETTFPNYEVLHLIILPGWRHLWMEKKNLKKTNSHHGADFLQPGGGRTLVSPQTTWISLLKMSPKHMKYLWSSSICLLLQYYVCFTCCKLTHIAFMFLQEISSTATCSLCMLSIETTRNSTTNVWTCINQPQSLQLNSAVWW